GRLAESQPSRDGHMGSAARPARALHGRWTSPARRRRAMFNSVESRRAGGENLMFLLSKALKTMIQRGTLTVIGPRGQRIVAGDGAEPQVTVRLHDTATVNRISLNPGLAVGEAYMDGRLTVENGAIYDLIELAMRNVGWGDVD